MRGLSLSNFPKRRDLHPYERSLIELTFGEGYYEQVLGRVDALRKRITSVGKQHASVCAKSTTKREAEEQLTEGRKKLEEAFQHGKHAIDDLVNVAKVVTAVVFLLNWRISKRFIILVSHASFSLLLFRIL